MFWCLNKWFFWIFIIVNSFRAWLSPELPRNKQKQNLQPSLFIYIIFAKQWGATTECSEPRTADPWPDPDVYWLSSSWEHPRDFIWGWALFSWDSKSSQTSGTSLSKNLHLLLLQMLLAQSLHCIKWGRWILSVLSACSTTFILSCSAATLSSMTAICFFIKRWDPPDRAAWFTCWHTIVFPEAASLL